ncbi:MAG: SpoIVB peptidase S55 domain-containing protein [Paenisporosarcina sp.]
MRWNLSKRMIVLGSLFFMSMPIHSFANSNELIPMGQSIGVQLKLEKVTFVHDVLIEDEIWFKSGDQILKVGEETIETTKDWKKVSSKVKASEVNISFNRDNKNHLITVSKNQLSELLPFMRDHTEGIGTLTYVDPKTSEYGALGHQIVDQQIEQIPPFLGGSIFLSEIASIHKSVPGRPGYKIAKQISIREDAGIVNANTVYGIFGDLLDKNLQKGDPMPTLNVDEINEGKAEILTTVNGNKVETYMIEIINVESTSFQFHITDERLIKKTGGILQGMSGSPIIQNNKFAGAITHMVVDNPTKGAAIPIREMIKKHP